MSIKQVGAVLLSLGILIAGFSLWALEVRAPGPVAQEQQVLMGSTTPRGDYLYTEDTPYYTIKAAYPAKTSLATAADLKARLTIEQTLASAIELFKADSNLDSLTAEDIQTQGLGPDRKYAFNAEYKTYNSPEYLSYFYTLYQDTLGAHPNGFFLTFVFDKQGNQVSLGKLFPSNTNWLEELSLVVSNDVVAQLKQRTGLDDVTGSIFAEGLAPKVENFSSFVIDGDTLVIEIPPYQVAAYAAGSFEVKIPLKDLQ